MNTSYRWTKDFETVPEICRPDRPPAKDILWVVYNHQSKTTDET